jgi:hypothetical protein
MTTWQTNLALRSPGMRPTTTSKRKRSRSITPSYCSTRPVPSARTRANWFERSAGKSSASNAASRGGGVTPHIAADRRTCRCLPRVTLAWKGERTESKLTMRCAGAGSRYRGFGVLDLDREEIRAALLTCLRDHVAHVQILRNQPSHLVPQDSPHSQTAPKVSAKTRCSASIAAKRWTSGASRCSGMFGMRS